MSDAVSVSAAAGETTDVDAAGRTRDFAYTAMRNGWLNEAQFIAIAATAMVDQPERFMDWLAGYSMSRFERTQV